MKEIYKMSILEEVIPVLNDVNKKLSVWPFWHNKEYLEDE